jgi:O-antigen ligase
MRPEIAALIFVLGILGLFVLDRDREARTSKTIWIPILWLFFAASREPSEWLLILSTGHARSASYIAEHYLEGDPVNQIVYSGLLLLGVIVLARRGRQVERLLLANVPILSFFLYCAVSAFWSDYPEVAFKRWIKALGDIVMVIVVLTDPDRVTAVKRLLTRTSFLLVPLSVLFIKYYPELGKGYRMWSGVAVYTGVAVHKNSLGIICLIFGLASVWRFFIAYEGRQETHRTRSLIVHGTLLAMVLWLFGMANSMTSLACFLLSGSILAVTSYSTLAQKPWVVHFLVAAVVAVPFSTLFFNANPGALEEMGRDPTLTNRTAIWELVLSLIPNPFLGTGFETFWSGKRLEKVWSVMPGIQEAHNGYLEVYLNLGGIGMALLAIVMVMGYRNVVLAFHRDPHVVGRLRLAYFATAVVYSFTEAGFRMLSPTWIIFLLAITAVPEELVPRGRAQDRLRRVARGLHPMAEPRSSTDARVH